MNTPIPIDNPPFEADSIKINVQSWKIKINERRNSRMRLQINLSKDEGLAYKNFASICKPDNITDSDFLKTVFVTGIEALNNQLSEMVRQYALDNQEELAASGITVSQGRDGGVTLGEVSGVPESTLTEE